VIQALLFAAAFAQDVKDEGQDYTIDVERFRPHADTYGYAVTEGASTLQHLQMGVGLWGNYSEDSVVMVWNGERVIGNGQEDGDGIIDNRSVADLQLGIGASKYFSFTIDAPVVLWQEGFEPASADNPNRTSELLASGISDLRLTPKLVLVDLDDYPVGLALITQVTLPTGNGGSFLGEEGITGMPMAILEFADGSIHLREYKFRAAFNAGYRAREEARFRDLVVHNEFVYRAAIGIHPSPVAELGVDVSGAAGGPRAAHKPLEILPWLKLHPHSLVTVQAGAGIGVMPGLGSPDFRVWAGATLAPSFDPSTRDTDKDGIFNDVDRCRLDPEDKDDFEDEDGCPENDNDKDGILDDDDRCPMEPEDDDGFKDSDGCPDLDNDKDGILDLSDQCPDDPETYNEYEDQDGCPDEKPIEDTDGDGYKDNVDRCPFDPEDFDQFEDADGCPEPDNDLDTIVDNLDSCPLDKEIFNGFEDEDGCPDEAPVVPQRVIVEKTRIRITETIFFDYNKATIRQISYDLLDEIARVILDNPQIKEIRVEGHTDSDGNDSYNLKLSQARAESVVNYLVAAGVERGRLDPVGFGESRPLVENTSDENKQTNRRVEFLIVEQD
jgi:outer membrane protein OmpA-like peptidoglycan-associated protein